MNDGPEKCESCPLETYIEFKVDFYEKQKQILIDSLFNLSADIRNIKLTVIRQKRAHQLETKILYFHSRVIDTQLKSGDPDFSDLLDDLWEEYRQLKKVIVKRALDGETAEPTENESVELLTFDSGTLTDTEQEQIDRLQQLCEDEIENIAKVESLIERQGRLAAQLGKACKGVVTPEYDCGSSSITKDIRDEIVAEPMELSDR